jgi:hypothetical protein
VALLLWTECPSPRIRWRRQVKGVLGFRILGQEASRGEKEDLMEAVV